MANVQIGSRTIRGALRGGKGLNGGLTDDATANSTGIVNANYNSLAAKRARLTAIDSAYYTSARLDTLTENDIDYALRLADNPTTI